MAVGLAETVDMITTGTDVKPIECVVFMRMVRSRNFFEQMKGRGVRVTMPRRKGTSRTRAAVAGGSQQQSRAESALKFWGLSFFE